MPRHTADLVALILAGVVAFVTIATAGAVLYIEITNPGQDIAKAAEAIARIISVIIAALVGYMAGRRIAGE
jgi:CHASE1-domain containing sensor protein